MAARLTVVRRATTLTVWIAALALLATPGRSQAPVVFAVIGDSGEVSKGLLNVVREMSDYHRERARFDFVLLLGDNIYADGVGRGLRTVFERPFAHLLEAGVHFHAVLGNHDIRRGTDLQVNYPRWNMNGRRFYSFSKGDGLVEFFGLDSTALAGEASALVIVEKARLDQERAALARKATLTASETRRLGHINAELGEDVEFIRVQETVKNEQLVWLHGALSRSKARWKVVFLHHSIYSAATRRNGHGGQKSVLTLRALLEPIFVDRRVDLVLAGHDHHYDRSTLQPVNTPNGHRVQYVTAGASARLRPATVEPRNTYTAKAVGTIHSFLIAHATTDAIRIEAIGADGKTLDSFEVLKVAATAK